MWFKSANWRTLELVWTFYVKNLQIIENYMPGCIIA